MIRDDDAPLDEEDFETALATAKDGFAVDWGFPDAVQDALDEVWVHPTDANIDAARAAWRTSRSSV